jgi:hypothetical protein
MAKEDKTDKSKETDNPVPDLKPKKDVKGGGSKPVSPGSGGTTIQPVPPIGS